MCSKRGRSKSRRILERVVRHRSIPWALVRSACVPSKSEKEVIKRTIEEAHTDLALLDEEIRRTRAAVEQLSLQRTQLQFFLDCQQSMLSPIRRVPDEVLAEVFLFSCPKIDIGHWQGLSFVWRLAAVSKHWRDVVISTPELWSSMDITLQAHMANADNHSCYMQSITHVVDTCLRRSGMHPISFSLTTHGTHHAFSTIFNKLFIHSTRWRVISLEVDWLNFLPNLAQIKHQVPKLQSLTLKARIGSGSFNQSIDAFEVAPCLQSLALENFPYPMHRLGVPWHQLTRYNSRASSHEPGEFCEVLRQMPNLMHFESSLDRGLPGHDEPPVFLPCLRGLSVRASISYFPDILKPLVMPLLNDFCLTGTDIADNFQPDPVMSLLRRSSCSLTRLSLTCAPAAGISRILEQCPSVQYLSVGFLDSAQELLRGLTRIRGSPFLLPKMHTFSLSFCNDGTNLVDSLIAMIKSRLAPWQCDDGCTQIQCTRCVVRLQRVQVNLGFAINQARALDLSPLEQFKDKDGFQLDVTCF